MPTGTNGLPVSASLYVMVGRRSNLVPKRASLSANARRTNSPVNEAKAFV